MNSLHRVEYCVHRAPNLERMQVQTTMAGMNEVHGQPCFQDNVYETGSKYLVQASIKILGNKGRY